MSGDKLNQEQRQQVETWLNGKTVPLIGACPMCNHRAWVLSDDIVQAMPFSADVGLSLGGPAFPLIVLICSNCGNVQFQSAVMIGLFPRVGESPPV